MVMPETSIQEFHALEWKTQIHMWFVLVLLINIKGDF